MKEKLLIEISAEQKKIIREEAMYQHKTMKDLIVDIVLESRQARLARRSKIPEFEKILEAAKAEYMASHKSDGKKMKELAEILAKINERITGKREWHWSAANLAMWGNYCVGNMWPGDGLFVFAFDGEDWTTENVCSKLGLMLALPESPANKFYGVANDFRDKWDVEAMIRDIIAKGAK